MSIAHARDEGPPALGVEVVRRGRRACVTVRGELDIATAPALERALIEQTRLGRTVVLHLRELRFIDVTALRALVRTNAGARRDGIKFAVVPGPRVQRLLDLCGLTPQFSAAPIGRPTDCSNGGGRTATVLGAARPVDVSETGRARA